VVARAQRRKPTHPKVRLIGVEGMGRVFTPAFGEAQSKSRCHECFAKAMDLNISLLQPWQHGTATRSAVAAL
jgi:hypothetical protein